MSVEINWVGYNLLIPVLDKELFHYTLVYHGKSGSITGNR